MVDPNRKINRLTDKDIEFLDECEEEFTNRFTENDKKFMEHCQKKLAEPPIIENWNPQHQTQRNHYNNRGGRYGGRGGGSDRVSFSNWHRSRPYSYKRRDEGREGARNFENAKSYQD